MENTTMSSGVPPAAGRLAAVAHAFAEHRAGSSEHVSAASTGHSLREATQEFESLLISRILQAMRRTVPESGLVGTGGELVFREFLDRELARQIAFAGGFGLGEILYQQLAGHPGDE